jgi:hypothetical protein
MSGAQLSGGSTVEGSTAEGSTIVSPIFCIFKRSGKCLKCRILSMTSKNTLRLGYLNIKSAFSRRVHVVFEISIKNGAKPQV